MISSRSRRVAVLAGAIALAVAVAAPAEARRGGSFGSRGSRTYSAPAPTYSSPSYVAPVQRSMTAPPAGYSPGFSPGYASRPSYGAPLGYGAQPGYRPGFGGGFLGGLATGGLIGAMMGHGFGGGYGGGWGGGGAGLGLFAALFQLALLALAIWFVVRLFRRRGGQPQPAFASGYDVAPEVAGPWGGPWGGAAPGPSPGPWGGPPPAAAPGGAEIPITTTDTQAFERLLIEVQDAFGREDYAGLRERTTPEVMSYLAEELSDNATHNRRNEVTRTRLLRSEVSEAWREGSADYATVALTYESVDVMRDRQTGQVVQGDPDRPTSTTELWTFVRQGAGAWKLSAIQET